MPKTYTDWGDGKKHSIPKAKHQRNVKTKRNARLNDPARFTAPRGALDVNRDATTSANLRYGDVERNQAQQAQQIPAWFQSYRDQVAGINQGIQAGYQKAIGDVNARAAATAQSDTTARNTLGSQMQADAKSRGATVDPSLLANDVNAASVRNTNQAAFANLLGSQAAANNTYMGAQQQVGSASELQQKTRLAADVRGTATDKGAYRADYVTNARGDERTNQLQRAAFEIPTANAQLTAQTQTANSRRTAKSQRAARKQSKTQKDQDQALARSRLKTQQEKIAYDRAHPKAGAKGLTPAQRTARNERRNKATNRVTDAGDRWSTYKGTKYDFGDGKPRNPSASELKAKLIKEGFSTQEIHIGWLIQNGKPFTAKDRQTAKRLGIKVPKQPKPPKYKAPNATADPKYGAH